MQTLHKTRTNQINKHKQQKSRPRYTQNERLKQRTRSKPSAGSSSNRRREQRRCCATYNKTCINKQQAKAKKTTTTKTKKKNNKNKTTHGKTDAKEQHKKKQHQQRQKQRQSSDADDDDDGNRQAKEKRWKKCTSKTELFPTAYDFAGQHWWLKRTNERASERTNEQSDKVTKRRSFSRRRSKRCKQQTQRTPGEEAAALHALQSQPYLKERADRERGRERTRSAREQLSRRAREPAKAP